MNIKRILLAFTLALSALIVGPAQAISSAKYMALAKGHRASLRGSPEEKRNKLEEAKSALKTFKKDIKCMFSRKGCTREQKIRLAKEGLGLLTVIAVLSGSWLVWKSRVKRREKAAEEQERLEKERQEAKRAERLRQEQETEEARHAQEQETARLASEEAARLEREQLGRERQKETARHEQERVAREEAERLTRERRAGERQEAIALLEEDSAEKRRALEQAERERSAAQEAFNEIDRIIRRTKKGEKELRLSAQYRKFGRVGFFARLEAAKARLEKAQESFAAKERELIDARAALERARRESGTGN